MRHQLTVAEVMTPHVVTVPASTPFKEVAKLLAEHRISAVPVTSESGGMIGLVSESDLLHKEAFQDAPARARLPRRSRRAARRKARAVTAGGLMSRPLVTIDVGATLPQAARLMAGRGVTRLLVTDGEWMAGIVTRSDLLRAFRDTDSAVLGRVRRAAVESRLWDDPFGVEIRVKDGVVTLTGELEHRSRIPVAVQAVREVDGVVDVENRLTYAVDDTVAAPGPWR
jgi:CBS-domain-containing membrane protein